MTRLAVVTNAPLTPGPRQRLWWALGGVVMLLALVAMGSSAEPGTLYTAVPQTPPPVNVTFDASQAQRSGPSGMPTFAPRDPGKPLPAWVFDLLKLVAIALLLWVVLSFVRMVAGNLKGKGVRKATAASSHAIELPEITEDEVVESFAETLQRLRSGGAVDDAILDCWRRLSEIAERSGVPRRASQTSEEFTVAILAHTSANPTDLRTLAGLYRQAMFSTHLPGDLERQRAVECLERLHDSMKPAPVAPAPKPETPARPASQAPEPEPDRPRGANRWGED